MNVTVTDATNTVEVVGPQEVVVTAAAAQVVVEDAGAQGPTGPAGPTGATGPAGPGVAIGGTEGQFLVKNSATNYDTMWQTDPLWPTLSSGDMISQPARMFSGGAPTVGTIRMTPLLIQSTTTFDGIGWYQWNPNTTAGANVRLGVYGSNSYKKPGPLILDAGAIQFPNVSFALQFVAVSLTLTPGLYWMAFVAQGNTTNGSVGQGEAFGAWVRHSFGATGGSGALGTLVTTGIGYDYAVGGITGALPDPVPTGSSISASPRVFMKVA
jgi:hypothetical protein